jgi:hypothetical protein
VAAVAAWTNWRTRRLLAALLLVGCAHPFDETAWHAQVDTPTSLVSGYIEIAQHSDDPVFKQCVANAIAMLDEVGRTNDDYPPALIRTERTMAECKRVHEERNEADPR